MKAEALRELSPDELIAKQKELAEQLFRLRFQKSVGQLDDPTKVRAVRRDIARVKTVLKQRQAS